jgi:hypothetical protein
MPKTTPILAAPPHLLVERERYAAEKKQLDAFDRHTEELQTEIANIESVVAQMRHDHDSQQAAAAAALKNGQYLPTPAWDTERHEHLVAQLKDCQTQLTRSLYSSYATRDAERWALQRNVGEAAVRLETVEAEYKNACELAGAPEVCAALLALAQRMTAATRSDGTAVAAEFGQMTVARKRDEVVFTISLAAASKREVA